MLKCSTIISTKKILQTRAHRLKQTKGGKIIMNNKIIILTILLIIATIGISGCITPTDNNNTGNTTINNINNTQNNQIVIVKTEKINNSGKIIKTNKANATKIKENKKINKTASREPKISKEDIEKEIVRIMKLENPNINFTAKVYTITYLEDQTPVYIVDVYDDQGWYGYFEVNGDKGPNGNDKDGYTFLGGAVRDEVSPNETNGVTPKITHNQAQEIIQKELKEKHNITDVSCNINETQENNTLIYNINITKFNTTSNKEETIANATMNANTGEIISLNIIKKAETPEKNYTIPDDNTTTEKTPTENNQTTDNQADE